MLNKKIIDYVNSDFELGHSNLFSEDEQQNDLFNSIVENLKKIILKKYLYYSTELHFHTHIREKYNSNTIEKIIFEIKFYTKKGDISFLSCEFDINNIQNVKTLFDNNLNSNIVFSINDIDFIEVQKQIKQVIELIVVKKNDFIEEIEKKIAIKNKCKNDLYNHLNNLFSSELEEKTKTGLKEYFPNKNLDNYKPKIFLDSNYEFNNEVSDNREKFLVIIFSLKEQNEKGYNQELISLFQFDISTFNEEIKVQQFILNNSQIFKKNSLKTFINRKLKTLFKNEIKNKIIEI